jgi:hypothetical protein
MVDCCCENYVVDLDDEYIDVREKCHHFTGDIKQFEGIKELSITSNDWEDFIPGIEHFRVPDSLTRIIHEQFDRVYYNHPNYTDEQIDMFFINNGYYDFVDAVNESKKDCKLEINGDVYRRRCINLNWLFVDSFGWDWNLNIIIDNYLGLAKPFKLLRYKP